MSAAASTTHHMQQIPPPQLPWHSPELPARPTVIPMLPTRVQQPGRQAPLPDAVAVRQCPVPDTAPPFDVEMSPATRQEGTGAVSAAVTSPPGQDQTGPGQAGSDTHEPGTGSPDAGVPDTGVPDTGVPDPGQTDRAQPGSPDGWPSQFAQVLAETLAGSRPARQLTPWTTEQARRRIRQLGPMLATDQRPKVRRVMTSAPAANVLELTAVVGFGPRVRVLALRLEREQARAYRDGGSRWCCTAIESA
jgi:hypothetical protein